MASAAIADDLDVGSTRGASAVVPPEERISRATSQDTRSGVGGQCGDSR